MKQHPWEEYSRGSAGAEQLAKALGWVSLGLGLAEVFAPGSVARLSGVPDDRGNRSLLRALGMREIATGVGILSEPAPKWIWGRVGGHAIDLALLRFAFNDDRADRERLMGAIAALSGVTILDVLCGARLSENGSTAMGGTTKARATEVKKAVTVNRPIHEVYAFWRDFEKLPRFMRHLESVQVLDQKRSRWKAKGPAGMKVEWDAEIIDERPNDYIAWRSVKGADVNNRGSVRFDRAPGGRGTELRVHLEYTPPGGAVGRTIAWLFGEEPEQQMRDDLRRFKQLMETGEIPLSDGP
jgi:uncharacterized membrane protein